MIEPTEAVVRFVPKLKHEPGGCWLWKGGCNPFGYGKHWAQGRTVAAHRWSWEFHYGPVPEGLCVLHRCDVRACVNPAHLFLGTNADNTADMIQKGRRVTLRGLSAPWSKLTEEQVREIHARSRAGESQRAIAKAFGINQANVCRILAGKVWGHLCS